VTKGWLPVRAGGLLRGRRARHRGHSTGRDAATHTTIWVVRVGDDLNARSRRGRGGGWFPHALQRHQGRIRAGGTERDVTFEEPDDVDHDAIEDAYRTKYARYARTYVEPMVSSVATAASLRLAPR